MNNDFPSLFSTFIFTLMLIGQAKSFSSLSLSDHAVHYPASLPSSRLSTKEQLIICNVFQLSYKQPPPKYHFHTLLCTEDRHLEKEGCRGVPELTFLCLTHIFETSLCPQKLFPQESGVKTYLRIQLRTCPI